MPDSDLIGSRLREQRQNAGLKQVTLAARAGISPSYLNLIEKNRRRIGGKLLLALAAALDVEPTVLTANAEEGLLTGLTAAATDLATASAEIPRMAQFANRYPGWARLITDQHQRLRALERQNEGLSDRLAHDPFLSETLHEVLSSVASLRSTSSILVRTPDLEPEWQSRFQTNLFDDANRLAETAQALVNYFDAMGQEGPRPGETQTSVEQQLAERPEIYARLERGAEVATVLDALALSDADARAIAERALTRAAADCRALTLGDLLAARTTHGLNPWRIAEALGQPADRVLRRLAVMPTDPVWPEVGLVEVNIAGAILWRRPIEGFPMPSYGAACALWPVFEALARPLQPISNVLEMPSGQRFQAHAMVAPPETGPVTSATARMVMVIYRIADTDGDAGEIRPVGSACRICPRHPCAARTDTSVVGHSPI